MASIDLFDLPAFAPEHRGGPRECADKLMSEAAEVFAAVRELCAIEVDPSRDNLSNVVNARYIAAFELADVLQVCRNICAVCEITPAMMADAMRECIEKNQTKDGGRYG